MTPSSKYGSEDSQYCYPGTNVLKNKLDIKDKELLEEADALYSAQRLLELQANPIEGNFDLQDLYDFAGEIGEEDIIKGNTHFAKSQIYYS
jgi:cell filamentation protein